jgi:hypothetical protein
VSGWGTLSSGGSSPDRLQYVEVPIITNAECQDAYRSENITDGMLCAGYLGQGGADSCQGDSGGPLVVDGNGELVQTGVVSWGYGCASASHPGVYARTSEYIDWIRGYVPNVRVASDGGNTNPPTEPTEPTQPEPPAGDDHGDTTATATVVSVDGVTTIDAFLDPGDEDVFRLELSGEGQLKAFTSGGTDTFGSLLASNGSTLVASDDDSGANYNFSLVADAADGDVYYLVVRGYDGSSSGAYTLTLDGPVAGSGSEPTDPGTEPDPGTDGGTISIDVSNTNNVTEVVSGTLAAGDVHSYVIELRDDFASNVVLEVKTTGGTDTFGSIYDLNGNLLASDDDSGASYNFQIAGTIATGTYLVEVRGYDGNTTGDYDLSVKASWAQ